MEEIYDNSLCNQNCGDSLCKRFIRELEKLDPEWLAIDQFGLTSGINDLDDPMSVMYSFCYPMDIDDYEIPCLYTNGDRKCNVKHCNYADLVNKYTTEQMNNSIKENLNG